MAEKTLAQANYLRELGRGLKGTEAEQAKNAAMFASIGQQAAARNRALREFVDRQQGLS